MSKAFLITEFTDSVKITRDKNDSLFIEGVFSTADLKTIEFKEYLEKCRRLAFDFFNVQIPLPNTQTEFNF